MASLEGVQGSGPLVTQVDLGYVRCSRDELCGLIIWALGKLAPTLLWGPVCRSEDGYLVDPASSHMLVLKAKPCMSKFKQFKRETANGSLIQS